jgi:hypothetical protein
MNNKSVVIFLFSLILSACCPMVSVNPLVDPENAEYDKRIEGTWKLISEQDEYVYLHIGRLSESKMVALSVEHKKNGELDTAKFPFFLTRSSKNNYMNIRIEDISDEISKNIRKFFESGNHKELFPEAMKFIKIN